jgi:hypothetical protein
VDFVKLLLNVDHGCYSYKGSSSIAMDILGLFLISDVRFSEVAFFRAWATANKEDPASKFCHIIGGNITSLEEEDGYVYFTDASSSEMKPPGLKMSRGQFIKLLDEWQEKVCKHQPKEVIIKHENGEFFIETKN